MVPRGKFNQLCFTVFLLVLDRYFRFTSYANKFQPVDQAPNRTLKADIAMQSEEILRGVRDGMPLHWEAAPAEDLGLLLKEVEVDAREKKTRSAR